MKYYQDITLLPDVEDEIGFLWQKVYQQIHIALVENKVSENESAIAISLPRYNCQEFPLGDKLRLLSDTQEQLEKLNINKWLNRLKDYAHYTSIRNVPPSVQQFACFRRKQFDTNIERMARRRVRRKGGTVEQALTYLNDFKDKETKLPFINIKSLSGEKQFKLFIEQEIVLNPRKGVFNCYGLSRISSSQVATIPWF